MNKKTVWTSLIILVVICAGLSVYMNKSDLPGDLSEWQAVFLADGQVYFGHLEEQNRQFFRLTEVHYLKYGASIQQEKDMLNSTTAQNLNLIKLGGEVHGPENMMYIPKDKILFIENLRPASGVVQAINKK